VGVERATCGDWDADREQEINSNMVANPMMTITDNFLTMFSSLKKQSSLFLISKEILAQPFYIVKRRILH
jgi:hypothetical protein